MRKTEEDLSSNSSAHNSTGSQSDQAKSAGEAFANLVATVELLRDPGGCPWDAEQTHISLRPNLLEETYETLEAIDSGDSSALAEELGDIMIQILFHADIARRGDGFDAAAVCDVIREKMIARHPHVFGDEDSVTDSEQVVDRWEALKRAESGGKRSIVASLPSAMPALAYSSSVQKRVMRAGLPWPEKHAMPLAFGSIDGESEEEGEERAGRYLMAVARQVNAAGIDAETALRKATVSLRDHVLRAEELAGDEVLAEMPDIERARVWDKAEVE
ncbi:MazG family protein [Candidatus Lucifugimonas marina]|uniref:MazG family protein n=1 Tax=Candidatus Lucifugimonas marina TaxID=3038979 RepID=A0AAJ5ZBH2_9CHLR|nr:MazG family protein [SAR202 cluster bacterium JH702]MDG0869645.1 MazG family protein [SAR202 cluster bacterium JH639]WFG34378.1 MazG family protein [SAR202 cluster bacterium JH545]WFG38307.1 MazG family protein [SAR202 cluster bacterium JH1073]